MKEDLMQKDSLTVKEALEQGYEYYVYEKDGYQALQHISDVEYIDFGRTPVVVEKEPYHPFGMSSKDIAELLADNIEENHSSESGDDTLQVYEAIKELDFTEAENKIKEALSKLNYYKATSIRLVNDAYCNAVQVSDTTIFPKD